MILRWHQVHGLLQLVCWIIYTCTWFYMAAGILPLCHPSWSSQFFWVEMAASHCSSCSTNSMGSPRRVEQCYLNSNNVKTGHKPVDYLETAGMILHHVDSDCYHVGWRSCGFSGCVIFWLQTVSAVWGVQSICFMICAIHGPLSGGGQRQHVGEVDNCPVQCFGLDKGLWANYKKSDQFKPTALTQSLHTANEMMHQVMCHV